MIYLMPCILDAYINDVRKILKENWKFEPQNNSLAYIKFDMDYKVIQEAKSLLKYSSLSIAEISIRLKFEVPSYFVRLFKNTLK